MVFLNRYPYNNGHALVMPIRHVGDMDELYEEELYEVFDTVRLTRKALELVMSPHGYNIGINLGRVAGAGVPGHFHVHIVPRWDGDTNFITTVGRVRVISQALEELYDQLAEISRRLQLPTVKS